MIAGALDSWQKLAQPFPCCRMDGVDALASDKATKMKPGLLGRLRCKPVKHGNVPAEPWLLASRKRCGELPSCEWAPGVVLGKAVEKRTQRSSKPMEADVAKQRRHMLLLERRFSSLGFGGLRTFWSRASRSQPSLEIEQQLMAELRRHGVEIGPGEGQFHVPRP